MVDFRKIGVLTSRSGNSGRNLGIGESAAEGDQSTKHPEAEDGESTPQILQLEPQARVDPSADHRGGDQRDTGQQTDATIGILTHFALGYLSLLVWMARKIPAN